MEGSFEDRWPSHRRRRRLADLNANHYHPGMKSEKYYDNHDCSSNSDETISDAVPANYGDASASPVPAAAAAAVQVLACPFCGKEFRSHKAVCGHMKVHREQGIKKDREAKRSMSAAGSRWGATGNRGCSESRGRAASTDAGTDQSIVIVVAAESKIVLQPKPLAFAPPNLNADEPDEGEIVAGYHYHPGMKSEKKYYDNRDCSSDSDETISDSVPANYGDDSPSCAAAANNNGGASSSPVPTAAAAAVQVLACPLCWKEFRSHKAVCGHMKVHREQGIKKDMEVKRNVNVAAVGSRWGATGNRGCSGSRGRAASTNAESDQSMAVVVPAESKIVLQPKPLAFAPPNPSSVPMASAMSNDSFESSSPKPMHNDAMETVVARAANPPIEAVVNLHASPPPPPGDQRSPKGYTCKKCGMWFRTHQGLGGHMVGHKNRERASAAVQDGAVPPYRSNAKPEKMHVCKVCAAEFPGGVQLGGHMRKHWAGPPINKKPRLGVVQPLHPPPPPRMAAVGVADLTLALPVKADEALPVPRPAVAGRVLLFGIDIGPGAQTPAAQQGTSATVIGVHQ